MRPLPSCLPSLKHFTLFCLISLNLACAGRATAHALSQQELSVELTTASGASLPTYLHRGVTYVQGEYGERYQIRIQNHSGRRREVVVTVDGRDVVNGQKGKYEHRGYVLDPYTSVDIQGFRKSDTEVATFRFTTPSDSYSSRMGTRENVGVIGVAVFEERPHPRPRHAPTVARAMPEDDEYEDVAGDYGGIIQGMGDEAHIEPAPAPEPRRSARSAPSKRRRIRSASQRASEIGTRYGEGRYSAVEEVNFVRRSSTPSLVLTLQYDSERGLRRRGVLRTRKRQSAFPAERRYAPPPP